MNVRCHSNHAFSHMSSSTERLYSPTDYYMTLLHLLTNKNVF